jgi:putative membrane protein
MDSKKIIRRLVLSGVIAGISWLGAAAQSASAASGSQDSASSATSSQSGKLAASDRPFMMKAAQGSKAEIELGQLAQQNASSPEVKQFGQRMVTDHTQASDQLKQVASQKGVTLPEKLNAKDAATKARLEKLSGQAFDRA